MNTYVVYSHHRITDWGVFYIGQGKDRRRAYSKGNRNKHWNNTVSKHGYFVIIRANGLSKQEANELEISLISQYGRSDKGEGCLSNQTDGGEGSLRITDSQKDAIRLSNSSRPISDITREKISASLSGKKLSNETKSLMSQVRKGKKQSALHRARLTLANKLRFNKITEQEYNDSIDALVDSRVSNI